MKHLTEAKPTIQAKRPAQVVIPMSQHTGAPCEPLVKVGDKVNLGQKIADAKAPVSAPLHASVSGTVSAIEPRLQPAQGRDILSVVIQSDPGDTVDASVTPKGDLDSLSPDDIKRIVREAGLVGMGGAGFPVAIKLSPPKDAKLDYYLLNGAECEPYLTADHRLMLENSDDVAFGLYAFMKATGVTKGFICIEDNKPDAIAALEKALSPYPGIEVAVLKTKYPQGAEKQIIKAVTGREVPSGGLPFMVGCLVSNVGTAAALATAIRSGMPLVDRVVTVTGAVAEPKNIRARLGTMFQDLIDQCGGLTPGAIKVIMGGPMMGIAQHSTAVPVIKGTSGILALDEAASPAEVPAFPCIRCGRCADSCPMGLQPFALRQYAEAGWWPFTERYHALDCSECGACAYRCPANLPLVHWIKRAKAEIQARRRKGGG
jgi:electron transport complex protein RnfC